MSEKGKTLLNELDPIWSIFSNELKNVFESSDVKLVEYLRQVNDSLEQKPLDKRVLYEYFNDMKDYSSGRTATK